MNIETQLIFHEHGEEELVDKKGPDLVPTTYGSFPHAWISTCGLPKNIYGTTYYLRRWLQSCALNIVNRRNYGQISEGQTRIFLPMP